MHPFTVGRKNWLLCDTSDCAETNTVISTMVEMAKAYNLKVYDYLKFLLEARPFEEMTDEEFEALTPWDSCAQQVCQCEKAEQNAHTRGWLANWHAYASLLGTDIPTDWLISEMMFRWITFKLTFIL